MPTVSEFLENNQSGVPPALQSIIDKVTGYANQRIGGAMGQTAAQGAALKGVMGQVGGLVEQGRTEQGLNQRLGITQSGAMDLAKMKEAGDTERTKMGVEPNIMEANRRAQKPFEESKKGQGGLGMGLSDSFDGWQSNYMKNNPVQSKIDTFYQKPEWK